MIAIHAPRKRPTISIRHAKQFRQASQAKSDISFYTTENYAFLTATHCRSRNAGHRRCGQLQSAFSTIPRNPRHCHWIGRKPCIDLCLRGKYTTVREGFSTIFYVHITLMLFRVVKRKSRNNHLSLCSWKYRAAVGRILRLSCVHSCFLITRLQVNDIWARWKPVLSLANLGWINWP